MAEKVKPNNGTLPELAAALDELAGALHHMARTTRRAARTKATGVARITACTQLRQMAAKARATAPAMNELADLLSAAAKEM
jgi:hypothetical protein